MRYASCSARLCEWAACASATATDAGPREKWNVESQRQCLIVGRLQVSNARTQKHIRPRTRICNAHLRLPHPRFARKAQEIQARRRLIRDGVELRHRRRLEKRRVYGAEAILSVPPHRGQFPPRCKQLVLRVVLLDPCTGKRNPGTVQLHIRCTGCFNSALRRFNSLLCEITGPPRELQLLLIGSDMDESPRQFSENIQLLRAPIDLE
jgi:hypothetical protein